MGVAWDRASEREKGVRESARGRERGRKGERGRGREREKERVRNEFQRTKTFR